MYDERDYEHYETWGSQAVSEELHASKDLCLC